MSDQKESAEGARPLGTQRGKAGRGPLVGRHEVVHKGGWIYKIMLRKQISQLVQWCWGGVAGPALAGFSSLLPTTHRSG